MTRLPPETYLDHIRTESARFREVLTACDPEARVPSCPDWSAADLLWHLATVQRWWAEVVAARPGRPGGRTTAARVVRRAAGDLRRVVGRAPRVLEAADSNTWWCPACLGSFRCLLGKGGRVLPVRVLDLPPALAILRMEEIAQDGEEPGLHVRARLEAVDVGDRPHQRLLDEVVRPVDVGRERDRKGTQVRRRAEHDVAQAAVDGHTLLSLTAARSRRSMISANRAGTGSSSFFAVS